eukprot:Awhi_evm1s1526
MDSSKKYIFILVVINILCVLIATCSSMFAYQLHLTPLTCSWQSLVAIVYVSGMCASYLIFLKRSEIVILTPNKYYNTYKIFRKVLKGLVYSMSIFVIAAIVFARGTLYFKERYCLELVHPYLSIVFLIGNIFCVCALLILFYYPLRQILKGQQREFEVDKEVQQGNVKANKCEANERLQKIAKISIADSQVPYLRPL